MDRGCLDPEMLPLESVGYTEDNARLFPHFQKLLGLTIRNLVAYQLEDPTRFLPKSFTTIKIDGLCMFSRTELILPALFGSAGR